MRNSNLQSDSTLVEPNSSYLTKHVCFETWSLTLPSLFWWKIKVNFSDIWIFHFNQFFARNSMVLSDFQSIPPNLSYYIKHTFHFHFFVYFYFVCFCSGFTFFPPISRGISLIGLNRNMKNMRKPSLRDDSIEENQRKSKDSSMISTENSFSSTPSWASTSSNFTLTSLIFINEWKHVYSLILYSIFKCIF